MKYHYYEIIEKLKKRGSIPGLESIRRLLDELNHPEDKLRIVHIAGTNGKGSVFAFLSSILQEGGYRVGRYISPTIQCYEERFQIDGNFIEKDKLERYFMTVEDASNRVEDQYGVKPTLFEVETAISFLYFAEENVDFALVETGMGGTLDATNIIAHPILTVISSISYDHKGILGDTLEEIAAQKAGIIKERIPVIVSENPQNVRAIIKERAEECKSPVSFVQNEDYIIIEEREQGSTFQWKNQKFSIKLPGKHQISNAVTALEAARQLRELWDPHHSINEKNMITGLKNTRWPGRLEIFRESPLFYRDGAHNPDAAGKLREFLEKNFTNKKIIYIMGVLRDKEYKKMLQVLIPLADSIYVFRPENERGLEAEVLAGAVQEFGKNAVVCNNVNQAVREALTEAREEDVIVAWGSLSFMEDMEVAR